MTKTLIISRFNPILRNKSQTIIQKVSLSTPILPTLQNFKIKLLSGSGFVV